MRLRPLETPATLHRLRNWNYVLAGHNAKMPHDSIETPAAARIFPNVYNVSAQPSPL